MVKCISVSFASKRERERESERAQIGEGLAGDGRTDGRTDGRKSIRIVKHVESILFQEGRRGASVRMALR